MPDNNHVLVVDADTLDAGTSDFAIEFRGSGSVDSVFIAKGDGGETAHGWYVGIASNYLKAQVYSNIYTFSGSATVINDDAERHVVVNFDRDGNMVGYINSVAETGASVSIAALASTSLNNTVGLTVGCTYDGTTKTNYLNGRMREVRLYVGRILTATEITYNYNNPDLVYDRTNLVMWLKTDEGNGTKLWDASGNGNHGTITGATWTSLGYKAFYIMLDKNKNIWVRRGENIFISSDLVEFDGKMVGLCGEDGAAKPNLVYFDNDTITEQGAIVGGALTTKVINSYYDFYSFGADRDTLKQCTRTRLVYEDKIAYNTGGFRILYRVDGGTWVTLDTITLTNDGKVKVSNEDRRLNTAGKVWDFKIDSDYDFKIIDFMPYFFEEPLKQW